MATRRNELGVGQAAILTHRHRHVDFLAYMYENQFLMATAKPKPVKTYDTLLFPFDWFIWGLVAAVTVAQIVALVIVDGVAGGASTSDCVFHSTNRSLSIYVRTFMNYSLLFEGVAISVGSVLQTSFPDRWFEKRRYHSRRLLLFQWLIMGCFISYGYKSTLNSTLISVR